MDYIILLQAILYHSVFISGFFVCIPVAVNQARFDGICILYVPEKTGQFSICDIPVYFGAIGMVVFGFLAGGWFLFFAMKSRKDKEVGVRMWTLPFFALNSALAFVTMVVACILTTGFKVSRDLLVKHDYIHSYWNKLLTDETDKRSYVTLLTLSQAGAWIGFLLFLMQTCLSAFRIYRNRLQLK